MAIRDDFTKKTKEVLAKRVGYICSNPTCNKSTVGPALKNERTINIGVAAHISAAAENGPRFIKDLTSAERKSIENGIWLCQNCAALIDRDIDRFSIPDLEAWKKSAEELAIKRLGASMVSLENFVDLSDCTVSNKFVAITYRLSNNNELICAIENHSKKYSIKLEYYPELNEWDTENNFLFWDNNFYFTLRKCEDYIISTYIENEIDYRVGKVKSVVSEKGINGLVEFLFDHSSKLIGAPLYSEFIEAFELFIGRENKEYSTQVVGQMLYFKIGNSEYAMDTYEGKIEELKYLIDKKAYDEIYTLTNENIWSEIYVDAGIEKAVFIPLMLSLWEEYWDNKDDSLIRGGNGSLLLDKQKEKSWRQLQIFCEAYSDVGDVIKFAFEIDDLEFYPLAVLTMMNIFNQEACYLEYCEYEFDSGIGGWKSVCVDFENDKPIFHIRESSR